MTQPVFFTSKTNRKDSFLLETRIYSRGKSHIAEKRASSDASISHLIGQISHYKTITSLEAFKSISVAKPKKTSDTTVEFDYMQGDTLERVIIDKILSDDINAATKLIDSIMTVIDNIPESTQNPTKQEAYRQVFSNSYAEDMVCANVALIDLNFDNFVLHNDKLGYYDYEWLFDFAVPKSFLKTRLLWFFILRHQELFLYYHAKIPILETPNGIMIPSILLNSYPDAFLRFQDFVGAENSFQSYVARISSSLPLERFDDLATVKDRKLGIDELIQTHHESGREKMMEPLRLEQQKSKDLQKQLDKIKKSKSYKVALKLSATKNKATFRK